MSDRKIKIELVDGVEGNSLYIDDTRVAGNKPWGGGSTIGSITESRDYFIKQLIRNFPELCIKEES